VSPDDKDAPKGALEEAVSLFDELVALTGQVVASSGTPVATAILDELGDLQRRRAALGPRSPQTGAERISTERARQISAEGYDRAHDDAHENGELAWAGACYAAPARIFERRSPIGAHHHVTFRDPWPWDDDHDRRNFAADGQMVKPATAGERIRMLEKAGALIAAEIDRLLRAR
jgi:hypothetical protein